mmetsp:Transcript_2318/g.4520  ORF Transcript_2318/g.4520 Transcript_2318/m.4520 type:complete len:96 (+) Transcript_2318:160-447(+)
MYTMIPVIHRCKKIKFCFNVDHQGTCRGTDSPLERDEKTTNMTHIQSFFTPLAYFPLFKDFIALAALALLAALIDFADFADFIEVAGVVGVGEGE